MRARVIESLYVGDMTDCKSAVEAGDWTVVHACRSPCFCDKLGRKPDPKLPDYLFKLDGHELFLNAIDPPTPLFQKAMFDEFLRFMRLEWGTGRNILIHCNKGESRAPTLAILFLAKVLHKLSNESFDDAWDDFELLTGQKYQPGLGIETWMREHWHEFAISGRLPSLETGTKTEGIKRNPAVIPQRFEIPDNEDEVIDLVRSQVLFHFTGFTQIEDKDHKWIEPTPNRLQFDIAEAYNWCIENNVPCRLIILKPRQVGCSTICAELCYHHIRRFPSDMMVMGDVAKRTEKVYSMLRDVIDHDKFTPMWDSKIGKNNTEKIEFLYDAGGSGLIEHDTALDPKAGISGTRQIVWMTEAARYMKINGRDTKVITAVLNSLAQTKRSLGIMESTPEGANGFFYDNWQEAVTLEQRKQGIVGNGWIKVFAPWFAFPEHRLPRTQSNAGYFKEELDDRERRGIALYGWNAEQIAWRRMKIANDCANDERMFDQDFAEDPDSCIDGDQKVSTDRGIIPIREVKAGDQTAYGAVVEARSMGEKPLVKVRTKLGFELKCTADHRIACSDGSWIQAGSSVGTTIRLQPPRFSESEHVVTWNGFAGVEKRIVITETWAKFLGYFMGDGSFSGDTLDIVGYGGDMDVVQDIGATVKTLFGDAKISPSMGGNAFSWRLTRKEFEDVFVALGIVKVRPGYKTKVYGRMVNVPPCIWRSPKSHVRIFLQSLFEADGWSSASKNNVKFFSCYENFARDVQLLLLGFGIHACLRRVIKRVKDKEYIGYELVLYSLEALKFNRDIGFISERKKGRGVPESRNGRKPQVYNLEDVVDSVSESGSAEVFDLQISDYPMFGAAGILVHNCFLASGRPRFNLDGLTHLEKVAKAQSPFMECGKLEKPKDGSPVVFSQGKDGSDWLWVGERPKYGCSYIGFIDPCTGAQNEGSQFPDAHGPGIIRAGYHDENAVWHNPMLVAAIDVPNGCRWDDELVAERLTNLAEWYGGCMIVPETGNGLGVINELRRCGAQIYEREKMDLLYPGKKTKIAGWETNTDTRPLVVNALANHIRERAFDCPYLPAVSEMKTFVINDRGKAEAKSGKHDDWVMGIGIGLYCLELAQRFMPPPPPSSLRTNGYGGPTDGYSGLGGKALS